MTRRRADATFGGGYVNRYAIGVVQLDTQDDKGANLGAIIKFVDEAADRGAKLVALPETANLIGKNVGEGGGLEPIPGFSTEPLMRKARERGVYIHCGSVEESIPGEERGYNTSVLIDPRGEIAATYRKLHTFDVTLPDGTVSKESARIKPGPGITVAETELGAFGFSICYDIRFPEPFRLMALAGAKVLFTPANFTLLTGKDHWEPLLRARAIENGCYVVAPAQMGKKKLFSAFGSSMVVDPWGVVIARSRDEPGVTMAEIDLDYVDAVRAKIPSLANRRADVYELRDLGRAGGGAR